MMLTLLLSSLSTGSYWFGLMLLIQGILLVLFASTITVHQSAYLLIILIFGITLLLCMAIIHPFKSTVNFIIQSSSLANLVLLSGFLLFAQTQNQNMEMLQTQLQGFLLELSSFNFVVSHFIMS